MARGYSTQGTSVLWKSGDTPQTEVAFLIIGPRSVTVDQSQESADVTQLSSTTGMAYVPAGPVTTTVSVTGIFDPSTNAATAVNLITETYGALTITFSDSASWTSDEAAAATNIGAFCTEFSISGGTGGALECAATFRLSGGVYP